TSRSDHCWASSSKGDSLLESLRRAETEVRELQLEDLLRGRVEIGQDEVPMAGAVPRRFDKERGASGIVGCLRVLPLVAHDKAAVQIQFPAKSRFREKPRPRFSARATVAFIVRTH